MTLFPTFVKPALPAPQPITPTFSEQIVSDAGTATDKITIGIVFNKGLFSADFNAVLSNKSVTFTIDAITIDNNDVETGTWTTLGTPTVTAKTVATVKRSFSYTVAPGRYKIRIKRNNPESTDPRAPDAATWLSLTGSRTAHPNYGNVTLIAVKSVSSDRPLNIKDNKLSVISTREIPKWVGGVWITNFPTSSLVWAMVDAFRAQYGGRMTDAFLDLPALKALDDKLNARGDFFNGRFTNSSALMDALETMGKAARCHAYISGGLLSACFKSPENQFSSLASIKFIIAI